MQQRERLSSQVIRAGESAEAAAKEASQTGVTAAYCCFANGRASGERRYRTSVVVCATKRVVLGLVEALAGSSFALEAKGKRLRRRGEMHGGVVETTRVDACIEGASGSVKGKLLLSLLRAWKLDSNLS